MADLHQRAEVSRQITERYAASLATVAEQTPLAELADDLGQRQHWKGRAVRALNPLAAGAVALLEAVSRGAFLIAGFRNRDLRALPDGEPATGVAESRRQSAKVTRPLRQLRGHGVIAKIAKTHRYQVTDKGRNCLAALPTARRANAEQLLRAA